MRSIVTILLLVGASPIFAQAPKPAPPKTPDEATVKQLNDKLSTLQAALAKLPQPLPPDVEIYAKAADWVLRHKEWLQNDTAKQTAAVIEMGQAKLKSIGSPRTLKPGATTVRAYRSRVDGSVQPYAVTLPANYPNSQKSPVRVDVLLHGRDGSLTEVKFLNQFGNRKPSDPPGVVIDVFGRTNNAYRWAGEADVFEALNDFLASEKAHLGEREVSLVLRGFSMGGAGSWHIGLHHPSRWSVVGPGAGFTTTRGYVKTLPDSLPDYVAKCLRIYDAVEYAENAASVPVVAYSGADDPQIAAARNIEERLKPLGLSIQHFIAPKTGHKITPEFAPKLEAEYAKFAAQGRAKVPAKFTFVTYTLKYNQCFYVNLLALDRHYEKTRVEAVHDMAGNLALKTENVAALELNLSGKDRPKQLTVNGQALAVSDSSDKPIPLSLQAGKWQIAPLPAALRKTPGLQGPIDDAFTSAFVCVPPSGEGWHSTTDNYVRADLARFGKEWDKYMRGKLPIVSADQLDTKTIETHNLILFGDPKSNPLIAKIVKDLPLRWTAESIEMAGKSAASRDHVPAVIFPNPLNPKRYVVLNSGHTFHASDFQGTNALLYPRLGDYAVLKPAPSKSDPANAEVIFAGLFDDQWKP